MSTSPVTNFTRAERAGDPSTPDACAFCHRTLTGEYFRVGDHLACAPCAAHAQTLIPPDSHKAFSRAVLFGIAAAIAGCIGYAIFGIATGITLGWIAIGVGYLVGWAMMKGSRGLGGRRYQITAAVLTYAAVAVAFVPMAIHEQNDNKRHRAALSATQQAEAGDAQTANADAARETGRNPHVSVGAFLFGIVMLLGIGLISPFLLLSASIPHGLINLFILYLGIQTAWRLTAGARVTVDGPFTSPLTS